MKIKPLPHWALTGNNPAFYDTESVTTIEQTGRVYAKMEELVEHYNNFVDSVNQHIENFENAAEKDFEVFTTSIRQEFQDFIDTVDLKIKYQDAEIARAVEYMTTNLNNSINEMLVNLRESGGFSKEVLRVFSDITNEISALESRMNTFTSLAEGSTTGDAELKDIRVGYNGTVYESAGAAVRGQVSNLKSDLSKIAKPVPSINLFDNTFDESGFIDLSTGANSEGSGYKRTSKYYEIDNVNAGVLYVILSELHNPFVFVFYDDNKTYTGYNSNSELSSFAISIPPNSKYFRIYTDNLYNLESCVSTVYTEEIVSFEPTFTVIADLAEESIGIENFKEELVNTDNLVFSVTDNSYLNYENGVISNYDTYRATADYIRVISGEEYRFGVFNEANAPSVEMNALSVAFYDKDKNYISGVYSNGFNPVNCTRNEGFVIFTVPENVVYLRLCVNDNKNPLKWYLGIHNSSKLYTERHGLKIENLNEKLQGKVVACFGDSIIGNTRDNTSTPSNISKACGATVYNFGFGGCRMSVHSGDWDKCSMYRLADDIYNGNFDNLETAINSGWSGMPGYFRNTISFLKEIDFSKVDVIIISYGTNDYREPSSVLDNANNKFDTTTVCGALRYAIKQIQSKYPHIQILVTSPVFRTFFVDGTTDVESYSDTKNWGSGTLKQYAEAYKVACEDMKVHFLDLYNVSGLNEFTRSYFYPADDGTHPNEYGRKRIGTLVGGKLKNII